MKSLKELQLTEENHPVDDNMDFRQRNALTKPTLSPYVAYQILKSYLGNPNGDIYDEDKTQWQWTVTYKDCYIEIYDWKMFSVSVAVYHKTEDIAISEKVATTIMVLMEKEAPRYKAKLKLLAKESTHKLVQNPYITYYRTAENLLELSKLLDKPIKIRDSERSPSVEPIVDDLQEYFIFWDKRNDVYRSAFLMYLASFEGFLNILYELYTRTDLRSSRLFERISREQVDVKLRMAPVYCDGFKVRIIDHEDKRFKNFLRLVNLRNDYVHANLVKTHERYIIEEDDFTFIVENEEPGETPTDINQLDLSHIELAKLYIDELVDMVIESLDPKTKREFKNFIFNEEIEVESFEGYLIPK